MNDLNYTYTIRGEIVMLALALSRLHEIEVGRKKFTKMKTIEIRNIVMEVTLRMHLLTLKTKTYENIVSVPHS